MTRDLGAIMAPPRLRAFEVHVLMILQGARPSLLRRWKWLAPRADHRCTRYAPPFVPPMRLFRPPIVRCRCRGNCIRKTSGRLAPRNWRCRRRLGVGTMGVGTSRQDRGAGGLEIDSRPRGADAPAPSLLCDRASLGDLLDVDDQRWID